MLDPTWDLFFSYRRIEQDTCKPFLLALESAGLRIWRDENSVSDFERITPGIKHGLACSKALLAWYTPTYLGSRACQWELTIAFLTGQGEGDAARRVMVLNPTGRPDHIQPVELRDARFHVPTLDNLDLLVEAVKRHLAQIPGPMGTLQGFGSVTWYGRQPAEANRFVGREQELWQLHSSLARADAVMVTGQAGGLTQVRGMGGIGKTMLVQEYAWRFASHYPGGIFWVRAFGNDDTTPGFSMLVREAALADQIRGFALDLGVDIANKESRAVESLFWKTLEERSQRCLWIVDDLPSDLDGEAFRRWLPPHAPHPLVRALITTRSRRYGALGEALDLDVIEPDEAYALLTIHRVPNGRAEEEAAQGLVEDLGRHPLAIDVTGAYLAASIGLENFTRFRTALRRPTSDELEFAAEQAEVLPTGHEASIAATLMRSIERLDEEGRDLLRLASLVAVAPIEPALVVWVLEYLDPNSSVTRPVARSAIRQVEQRSLLNRVSGSAPGAFTIHSLVSRAVRFQEGPSQRVLQFRAVAVIALMAMLSQAEDKESVLTHARTLVTTLFTELDVKLLAQVADNDVHCGNYAHAVDAWKKILDFQVRERSQIVAETLLSIHNLAVVLREHGELDQSKDLLLLVLANQLQEWGNQHPATLAAQNQLGVTLLYLGDTTPARALLEQVVRMRRRMLGEEHPDTLSSLGNLASVLGAQGDWQASRPLCEQVVGAYKRTKGEEDPDTLTAMHNLAMVLLHGGEAVASRELQEQVLSRQRRVLGPRHPHTILTTALLVRTLESLGDSGAARHRQELQWLLTVDPAGLIPALKDIQSWLLQTTGRRVED